MERREADRQVLEKTLRQLEAKEKATIEAQIAGIMAGADAAAYAGVLSEIAKDRESHQARLAELNRNEQKIEAEKIADVLARIFADVEEALNAEEITTGERRQLLTGVVEKIVPHKDDEGEWSVLVTLRSPLIEVDRNGLNHAVLMISIFAANRGIQIEVLNSPVTRSKANRKSRPCYFPSLCQFKF